MDFLSLQHLTKAYQTKVAVNDISLNVPQGSIFGLLGPNGAGKTSLIRMITRITLPDAGQVLLRGLPMTDADQRRIGYMPEERGLYKKIAVAEQVVYLLQLKGMPRALAQAETKRWLERFELGEWKNRKVDELSKGMQQKVQFITTVAHKPELLILDEPFSGLDPLNAQLIEEVLQELHQTGTTLIFSTHRMEQVEEICNEIALINQGRVVLQGDVATLRRQYRQRAYTLEADESLDQLQLPPGVVVTSARANQLRVTLPEGITPQQFLAAINQQVALTRFELYLPSLREIFIQAVAADNSLPLAA